MSLIKPFPALRPPANRAAEVAAPPYDVMSTAEARAMVRDRPNSFLHVSRAEVDLPEGTDPYSDAVYAKARENLERMRSSGVLARDPSPRLYGYRLTMTDHQQTGLAVIASVSAYTQGRIRRHELTRPAKETDRVRQIAALDAQTGPVFLAYRAEPELDDHIATLTRASAETRVTAADGVVHEIWPIDGAADIAVLCERVDSLAGLYICDGHHRAAAAARVAEGRRERAADSSARWAASDYFLAVLFAHDQLRILPYNRVVTDLNGLAAAEFIERLCAAGYRIDPSPTAVAPSERGAVGLYLDGRWYHLQLDPALVPEEDPVRRLDVSLLHDNLVAPILGITDARRDERIDFVGGIRGLDGLRARVDSGEMRAAFSLPATRMADLMAVADAGDMMPPKSTWFEPKLADGLVSHLLD